jgi:murein L,D-transpeptidase YcbB/YkuD
MHGTRFDRLLAGTALALILAGTPLAYAQTANAPSDDAAISAAVPVPEPADVPPPTVADIGAPSAEAAPAEVETAVQAPEPAVAPPTTAAEIAKPAPEIATPAAAVPAAPVSAAPAAPPVSAPATAAAPAATPVQPTATAVAPAAEPTTAAIPAPAPAPTVDQQVADSLRAAFAKAGKRDKALESFYAARNFAPVWVVDGAASARTKAASAYLAKADADGLDPADYVFAEIKAGADPATLAETELKIATTLISYARHATNGRVHYTRVSADVFYPPHDFDPAQALAKIAGAPDVAAALDGFNPQQPGYKALKAKLAEVRGKGEEPEPVRVPSGPTLRPVKDKAGSFVQDARVPLLRQRLGIAGDAANTSYDEALADAVRTFQRQNGLTPDGLLGNRTVEVLNGGKKRDRAEDVILANMERWRWLPQDLGKSYVMLNIPDFTLRVVNNGKPVWTTRVVVGKPGTPTPILTETMKYITVNPTWNVPPSIIYNEYLPALQQDPTVLDRMGLKLTQNRDGSVHISQPPGERNALGRIRFNFPNKFLVYQHDTPDKNLFAKDVRAYSHGCMRVQDPAKYAEVLLGIALPAEGYTADRITKMYGSGERDIRLPTPIPVHITYQTAFVDDAGKLQLRNDIYGRDSRVLAALKGDDRRIAETPVERPQQSYARPPVRLPERFAAGGYNNGGGFFERLFGGWQQNEPPAPVRNNRRTYSR